MIRPTERTALVTHRNCLDGTGSAAVFILAGGKEENVFFRDPKGCALTTDEAAPFDEVWFVDVCPWDLADPAGGKPWKVFDHHDTAIRRHNPEGSERVHILRPPHGTLYFDSMKCGTSIIAAATSRYSDGSAGALQELVETIEHYDLGRFDANYHVKQLADLASTYSQIDMVRLLVDRGTDILYLGYYQNRGIAVGDARAVFAENAAKSAHVERLDLCGKSYSCAIVCSPRDWGNDIAARLLENLSIDIAVIVDYTRNSVSLRTREGGPNVAKIAEAFGGGGHPKAAGIRLDPKRAYSRLLEEIFG